MILNRVFSDGNPGQFGVRVVYDVHSQASDTYSGKCRLKCRLRHGERVTSLVFAPSQGTINVRMSFSDGSVALVYNLSCFSRGFRATMYVYSSFMNSIMNSMGRYE
jgi:hypothetical protein